LLLAPVLVVPLGLHVISIEGRIASRLVWAVRRLAPAGAATAIVAFLLPVGLLSGLVALGWLLVCSVGALAGILELIESRSLSPDHVFPAAALGFLAVGAAWLVAYRAGFDLGFGPTIAELTAVHFHYAGFGATLMSSLVSRRLRSRLSAGAGWLVVAGTPTTAAGFALGASALFLVGPIILAAGLLTNASLTALVVAPRLPSVPRWLLTVSSVSVFIPMLLGVDYALSREIAIPALDLRTMAIVHGDLNAVLYALIGLAGWSRA
jgi:hypothetical protein